MNARMVLSLLALTATALCQGAEVKIYNDIMDLVHADEEKYGGFRHLKLYCNNQLVEKGQEITIDADYPCNINFVLPANVIFDNLNDLPLYIRMLKMFSYLLVCNIKTVHTPEDKDDQVLYATEILISKTESWQNSKPAFSIHHGGGRTVNIIIHENEESVCI